VIDLFSSRNAHIRAIERLDDRLLDLSRKVDLLDTANKKLALEWEELYDKVRHQMSRMSRRVKLEAGTPPEFEEVAPAELDGVPKTDPVSQSIMLRRGMRTVQK